MRLVVSCRSDRGVSYVHDLGVRDGVRVGTGGRAEMVTADAPEPTSIGHRRQAVRVDAAYRE